MFDIRPTTLGDADAVTALLKASYENLLRHDYGGEVLARSLPLITTAQPRLLGCGSFYVAVAAGGQLVACGGWTKERPPTGEVEPGLGHMRHFATHPGYVRKGAARAIVHRCFLDASMQGVDCFECSSTLGAVRFYASLGFVEQERSTLYLPGDVPFPYVRMRRG